MAISRNPTSVHTYAPYGTAIELLMAKDREVLYCGPAGTGKSRACIEKLHILAMKYPEANILMIRKTQASQASSTAKTYEAHVAKEHLATGEVQFFGGSTREPPSYRYKNGSRIVLGGMDKDKKVLSTEYDIVYVNESNELNENDWEILTTRLRNGKIPYQQLIADCNPDMPTHWLKIRCDKGMTRMIESRHEDNPVYFDQKTREPTVDGKNYLMGLDALTGVRYLRYRKGIWAAAEGLVYDGFDPSIHIHKEIKEPPKDWTRYLSIDFGYNDPFVCQFWAVDNDGTLYLYKEIYKTQDIVENHAKTIRALLEKEPRPKAIITDHSTDTRKTLEKHLGMPTKPAYKKITEGVQAVASRLQMQGNGKPRIYLCRDALVNRDLELESSKRPCSTLEEITGFVWNKKKDMPEDGNDHGMDAMRYMVAHLDLGSTARADRTFG